MSVPYYEVGVVIVHFGDPGIIGTEGVKHVFQFEQAMKSRLAAIDKVLELAHFFKEETDKGNANYVSETEAERLGFINISGHHESITFIDENGEVVQIYGKGENYNLPALAKEAEWYNQKGIYPLIEIPFNGKVYTVLKSKIDILCEQLFDENTQFDFPSSVPRL